MSAWKIEFHPEVQGDFEENVAIKDRQFLIDTITKRLSIDPDKIGKPLGRELAKYRRVRISKYRVIYQIKKNQIIVYVLMVDRRETIYHEVFKRLGI